MNEETEPLEQFHAWFDRANMPGGTLDDATPYTLARAAFYAGFAARPRLPIEPSRDALDDRKRVLAKYAPPRPYRSNPVLEYPDQLPPADYIQHGTITGRFPRRDPEKGRRLAEAWGAQPVAGPDPATLERVHAKLRDDGMVEYPEPVVSDETMDFPAVTRADTSLMPAVGRLRTSETVWQPGFPSPARDETFEWGMWGAPGPVPTSPGLQEDTDAAS